MVGPQRPQFVLFGSSIVQLSFSNGGWGAILADVYARKADIVLRGYYGWNSRRAVQILDKVFPKDAAVQPELVIAYFGGNDSMGPHSSGLGPHVPLPEYIENMRKVVLHLKSLSDTIRIIFLSSPPVNEAKVKENTSSYFSELVRNNDLCKKYSDACIDLCKELGVMVVDLFTSIQKREDWENTCFISVTLLSKLANSSIDWLRNLPCFALGINIRKLVRNVPGNTAQQKNSDGVHLAEEGSKVVVEEILKVLKEADWTPSLHWKSMPTEFPEDSEYDLVASDGKTTINPSEWTFHRAIKWD
nr:GDSL esterase/lipase CPRD49 [Ipomoea batatas]